MESAIGAYIAELCTKNDDRKNGKNDNGNYQVHCDLVQAIDTSTVADLRALRAIHKFSLAAQHDARAICNQVEQRDAEPSVVLLVLRSRQYSLESIATHSAAALVRLAYQAAYHRT